MNIDEFAALKVDDQIENPMLDSKGIVSEVTREGVRIAWEGGRSSLEWFLYTASMTSWMHWIKSETKKQENER